MATSLKLIIDPKANKVLFAEADKTFVDFLCSLLCLPFGAAIDLLKEAPMLGSVETLYKSIQNLKADHMQPDHKNKELILKPRLSIHASNLPLCPSNAAPLQLYSCPKKTCTNKDVTYCKKRLCSSCIKDVMMNRATSVFVGAYSSSVSDAEGFVKGDIKYMVMDDLSVSPINSIESCFDELSKMKFNNFSALERKVVLVGSSEVVELLKTSLQSKEMCSYFLVK